MSFLLAAAASAAAVLTWAHLRPRGARAPLDFPSLQHVQGVPARRRRLFPLEERMAWALRLASLALAVLGLMLGRTETPGRAALGDNFRDARAIADASLWLGFDGAEPRAEGEGAAAALELLRSCSDTRPACLVRAGGARALLVVSDFGPGWEHALDGRQFAYLRREAAQVAPTRQPAPAQVAPTPQPEPVQPVKLTARGGAARIWAAALTTAHSNSLEVADRAGNGPTLIPCAAAGPATEDHPAIEVAPRSGFVLPDPLDLAAGLPALPLSASLRFAPDPRFRDLSSGLAVQRGSTVAVAATPEELGRWAHDGSLLPLARALAGAVSPVQLTQAPPGGAHRFSPDAPVGVRDVAPKNYLRDDGRVRLEVTRAVSGPLLELSHGAPWLPPARRLPSPATALLGLALLLWLIALAPAQTLLVRLAQLFAAALLVLFAADLARPHTARPRLVARADPRIAPAGVEILRGSSCDECVLIGTAGLAEAPPQDADALVFAAQAPRVDLLEVRAPAELPLDSAAEIWATVRVRRAAGSKVTVTTHPSAAAPARAELQISSADEVQQARLVVAPPAAGPVVFEVKAALPGGAEDARLLSLTVRAQPVRRLVLAAAPSWEARAAEAALEAFGDAPASSSTRLGTSALLARGVPARSPAALLEELDGIDTVILTGFREQDLAGAPALGLRRFLERGGAAILLGAPGSARLSGALFGWPEAGEPDVTLRSLTGLIEGEPALSFRGYPPPRELALPLGGQVLGRLGTAPWIIGRASGRGRAVVIEAPDLWRVSPPAGRGASYRSLLAHAVAWAEGAGVKQARELQEPDLLTVPRARLRALAALAHRPFLELDSAAELAAAWSRVPQPLPLVEPLKLRKDHWSFLLLAALIAAEALLRRSARGN